MLGIACTGQILGGSVSDSTSPMASQDGSSGGSVRSDAGADGSPVAPGWDDAQAESSGDSAAASSDASEPCETVVDSHGNARCVCSAGSHGLANGVASCAGYDCCASYGADSGVSLGFANPALTDGLCACFTSADLAAITGVSTTCADFVGNAGTVVPHCP
jgi:hypothetical protein